MFENTGIIIINLMVTYEGFHCYSLPQFQCEYNVIVKGSILGHPFMVYENI